MQHGIPSTWRWLTVVDRMTSLSAPMVMMATALVSIQMDRSYSSLLFAKRVTNLQENELRQYNKKTDKGVSGSFRGPV